MNWIEKKVFVYYAIKIMGGFNMGGWKTWASAIGFWATGVAVLTNCIVTQDYSHLPEAIVAISAGFGAVGLGHKIEKTK